MLNNCEVLVVHQRKHWRAIRQWLEVRHIYVKYASPINPFVTMQTRVCMTLCRFYMLYITGFDSTWHICAYTGTLSKIRNQFVQMLGYIIIPPVLDGISTPTWQMLFNITPWRPNNLILLDEDLVLLPCPIDISKPGTKVVVVPVPTLAPSSLRHISSDVIPFPGAHRLNKAQKNRVFMAGELTSLLSSFDIVTRNKHEKSEESAAVSPELFFDNRLDFVRFSFVIKNPSIIFPSKREKIGLFLRTKIKNEQPSYFAYSFFKSSQFEIF